MNILWIVNIIFPYPSEKIGKKNSVFGGWLLGLHNSIKQVNNINLAIAATYNGEKLLKFKDNNTIYYLIPCKNNRKYNKKIEKYWKEINNEFKPDLVHLHGTEYAHGLAFLKVCPNVKSLATIQGLTSICANNYIANIKPVDLIKNITLKDIIKQNHIIKQQSDFEKLGKIEKEILQKVDAITGRTTWDYANSMLQLNNKDYYKCNENLRKSFYNKEWDIKKIEKYSIFVSQANYPLKGFHIVIEAINKLKKKYPNIKVYVSGLNITETNTIIKKIKISGYGKYLKRKIKKYQLENIIEFTGILNEKEILNKLLKCNLFLQSSSIENSSNSLGEAMILGMPCVASNVGGTSDLLIDKNEGYLYPFGDYGLMAYYISKIFDNDELANNIGKNAKKHATITHDINKNTNDMLEIYYKLGGKNEE